MLAPTRMKRAKSSRASQDAWAMISPVAAFAIGTAAARQGAAEVVTGQYGVFLKAHDLAVRTGGLKMGSEGPDPRGAVGPNAWSARGIDTCQELVLQRHLSHAEGLTCEDGLLAKEL